MLNPVQMMGMMRNPKQAINSMFQQNLQGNPLFKRAQQMANGKSEAELRQIAQNLCQQKGIKPGKLCADLGISRGLMTDLKMDRRTGVSAQTADKIAKYLGVSVGFLLGTESARESSDVLDEVDIAFYGEFKQLDQEQQETIRDMVRLMRQRREKK